MTECRARLVEKPMIMGILNATPDSFSDGGLFASVDAALCHGLGMQMEGADIIDVGGESTRPGSDSVVASLQISRVLPVIKALRQHLKPETLISIDTTQASVARAALACGAVIINDVSAGRADPAMFEVVAEAGVHIILMHMQGTPKTMQEAPSYSDVVGEVLGFLLERAEQAMAAGIEKECVLFDPGIGFGKRREDNLRLLAELERLCSAGFPVVLGTSRKRFMGAICSEADPKRLLGATVATTAWGVAKGARIFRVHDVRENRQAADIVAAFGLSGPGDPVSP